MSTAKLNSFLLLAIQLILYTSVSSLKQTRDICTTTGDYCMPVKDCPYFSYEDIKKGTIRPPICGFNNSDPLICCTANLHSMFGFGRRTKSAEKCAQYDHDICVAKTNANNKESNSVNQFPFMTLIGFGPSSNVSWNCAGSLISNKYILSSAQCAGTKDMGPAKWIKLGYLNISASSRDNKGQTQIFSIASSIRHPEYRPPSLYNDIALYRLNREVVFNEYVKPACLHQYISILTHRHVIATGLDSKNSQYSSMKIDLDIMPHNDCSRLSDKEQLPNGFDTRAMLCAGRKRATRNPCPSTFGAPVFLPSNDTELKGRCSLQILVAVTSNPYQCSGGNNPGIYTNVANYIQWIESIVWQDGVDNTFVWAK